MDIAPQVVIETNTRNKKKMVTTVTGLDLFGVKLAEASKAFGKKFACGCSVTKGPTGAEQIDMQVRQLDCHDAWVESTWSYAGHVHTPAHPLKTDWQHSMSTPAQCSRTAHY